MKVLAIDPGERVGWARATVTQQGVSLAGHGITELKPFAVKLASSFNDYDLVIYERYRIARGLAMQHAGSDVPTLQLVGMIRLLGWLHSATKLVAQTPQNMNTAFEKLIPAHYPQLGAVLATLPKSHDDSHDASAIAHLAFYHFKEYA